MRIGIVGMGYVGLTLGIAAAIKGIKVYGIESSKKTRDTINKGRSHFFEPGINNHLKTHYNKNLFVNEEFDKSIELDCFIITVGTPLVAGSTEPNYNYLKQALESVQAVSRGNELIILRSTVSVGTTRKVVIPFMNETFNDEVKVAFCPERTVEGNAINELFSLPQIIGANSKEAYSIAENFFRELTPYIIKVNSLEAAELVKLFNNTYRDIHFAIGNAFNEIAQSFGLDGHEIIQSSNLGYDRSNIALPGFVGGPCLEKDPYILSVNMPDIKGKDFVLNARRFNESLETLVVDWVKRRSKDFGSGVKIGISGLAFKGKPDTSDLRGSNSVNVARALNKEGYQLELHDYLAFEEELKELNLGSVKKDLYDLIDENDIILIMNNNPRYKLVDIERLASLGRKKIILDSWKAMEIESRTLSELTIENLGNFLVD